MIFVTLGSQKFQFNRLLKEIDILIENGVIQEEVIAQIGYSTYKPANFEWHNNLDYNIFIDHIQRSDIVITHAGTGVIMTGIKNNKIVIAIPRLSRYNEHVDDHQIQIASEFKEMGFIEYCNNPSELEDTLLKCRGREYQKYNSSNNKIVRSILDFINGEA